VSRELAVSFQLFGELLDTGLPIDRALVALEEMASPSIAAAISKTRGSVREGKSVAASLEASGLHAPSAVLGLIAAGEATGGLPRALADAGALMEEREAAHSALLSSVTYPLIVLGAAAVALVMLIGVVVPRFAAILADLGKQLPPVTAGLMRVSGIAEAGLVPGAAILLAGAAAWQAWVRSDSGRRHWHELLLSLPFVGPVRRSMGAGHSYSALAAMLATGVPLAAALSHASGASGDAALALRIMAVREAVIHGAPLSRAMAESGSATALLIHMVRAGEASGRVPAVLARGAALERAAAVRSIQQAVRLVEPALVLLIGAVVALVAAGLMQALYSVRIGT
jgi:general secretion pathway protein F